MTGEVKKGFLYLLTGVLCFAVSAVCFFFFVFHSSMKTTYNTDAPPDLYNIELTLHFGLAAALLLGGLFLVPYGIRKISKFDRDAKKKGA